MQQQAGAMRGREGGATRGQREAMQRNIYFKRTITVDCSVPMALKKEIPLHRLDGEAPSLVKVGKVGWHKEVLVVLRRHTQSFRWLENMVVA
jgi:hypothetical protein